MVFSLLKHLGDVATVLLDWVCLSLFCFFMWFQTDWWWSDQICVWSTRCRGAWRCVHSGLGNLYTAGGLHPFSPQRRSSRPRERWKDEWILVGEPPWRSSPLPCAPGWTGGRLGGHYILYIYIYNEHTVKLPYPDSDSLCKQTSHWIITINGKMNVWKCKLIFLTDTLQQKRNNWLKTIFLAAENTSVLIILATTVYINLPWKKLRENTDVYTQLNSCVYLVTCFAVLQFQIR